MYTRIVVGYDGKSRSHEAVGNAARLARAVGAELHVVTAVPKDRLRDLDGGPERRAVDVDAARVALEQLLEEFTELTVTDAAVKGDPSDVLIAETERVKAELIVVGNRHAQGISRVLGSVAEHVSAQSAMRRPRDEHQCGRS